MSGDIPSAGTAAEMAALLKLAANPNRLRILRYLADGERAVADLERDLDIRQPTLSQQLGELRAVDVVATRRAHRSVFYRLSDERMRGLLAFLDTLFGRAAPLASDPARRTNQAAVFGVTE